MLILVLTGVVFSSCNSNAGTQVSELTDNNNQAAHFSLNETDSCTILNIKSPWQGAAGVEHIYYLADVAQAQYLRVPRTSLIITPVRKIVCMSSTHVAMICALGEQRSIAGISGTNYVYDETILQMIDSGLISEVGYDSGINSEVILRISPDLIMMYGIGNESAGYISRISGLGLKVMFNADYLETNPLSRAEWIRVFGALYCKKKLADSIFKSLSYDYNLVKEKVKKNISEKPRVLLGLPYRDTWYVSPGNSYINTLITDAGGYYLWNDTESDFSMPYSFESVFVRSLNADFWLNTGSADSKKEISAFDSRLEKIPGFHSGKIYNNTSRMSAGGGNDYWESGTMNPQIILKDIASILHPGLFPEHDLVYYKKIE
ncbi:MAG TPA: ABC transporter substrate-binding protein [Bacteroidales bacterium]|nr:ABC transporter substrate-binding protein [Bacteroidales bacterium]HPR11224.1 ABC transporter substrate-binding protein [Bacteroidales bacterium]